MKEIGKGRWRLSYTKQVSMWGFLLGARLIGISDHNKDSYWGLAYDDAWYEGHTSWSVVFGTRAIVLWRLSR